MKTISATLATAGGACLVALAAMMTPTPLAAEEAAADSATFTRGQVIRALEREIAFDESEFGPMHSAERLQRLEDLSLAQWVSRILPDQGRARTDDTLEDLARLLSFELRQNDQQMIRLDIMSFAADLYVQAELTARIPIMDDEELALAERRVDLAIDRLGDAAEQIMAGIIDREAIDAALAEARNDLLSTMADPHPASRQLRRPMTEQEAEQITDHLRERLEQRAEALAKAIEDETQRAAAELESLEDQLRDQDTEGQDERLRRRIELVRESSASNIERLLDTAARFVRFELIDYVRENTVPDGLQQFNRDEMLPGYSDLMEARREREQEIRRAARQ